MTTEVRVPALPESVSDGVVVCWHKQAGDVIKRDEALVDIETDKVVLEVPAPADGVLEKILFTDGDTVIPDQVIGVINAEGSARPAVQVVEMVAGTGSSAGKSQPGPGPAARRLMAATISIPNSSGQPGSRAGLPRMMCCHISTVSSRLLSVNRLRPQPRSLHRWCA